MKIIDPSLIENKINDKDINNLTSWDAKELRKLRINAKNRIEALKLRPKSELGNNHILKSMEIGELEELLLQVKRAEKALINA
jgi:hypothetical protein